MSTDPRKYLLPEDIAWLKSMGWEVPLELLPLTTGERLAAKRLGVNPREVQRMRHNGRAEGGYISSGKPWASDCA